MALLLYDHNQKAYDAAIGMLDQAGKAAVIHPTGTGKSFIGFKLAEAHPQAHICWLAPSRYIFGQQKENLKKAAPECVIENITFLTYAGLAANRDRVVHLKPDYIILDEFHRCGAAEWGKGVQALLHGWPQAKVLGLSATGIRYLDEQRNMAEELFDGHVASEMTLGEAIARGILAPPKYVISIYRYEKEVERYRDRICLMKVGPRREQAERQLQKLRRALEQADGLDVVFGKYLSGNGKYIVFCAGMSHLEEMKAQAQEWFARVNTDYRIYTVCSENPESEKEFRAFKEDGGDGLKLLFCIDMLNEGIHVEDVDGVILMRPTVSPVIYRQQIGRALTAGRSKRREGKDGENREAAAPLILDVVNNFENLHSIDSVELEYEEALKSSSVTDEYLWDGEEEITAPKEFQILDETRNARRLFEELQEKLCAGWDDYYKEAAAYHQEYGNLDVPSGFMTPSGLPLGSWLLTQRRIYMGKIPGRLSEEQILRLEELGISWESHSDRQWERYYSRAAEYYARNGNLDVKGSYVTEDGFRLGMWLNNIRQYRANGSRILSGARQRQLEQIGMIWDRLTYKWERGYEAARQYYERHGNLDVPSGYEAEDGFHLGSWITAQRQNRKGGNKGALPLTREQVERLDQIGMNWTGKQAESWEQYYEAAREYRQRQGTLDVPYDYVTDGGLRLGRWIYQQRCVLEEKQNESERIGSDDGTDTESGNRAGRGFDSPGIRAEKENRNQSRIRRLTEIGMIWTGTSPWQKKWNLARRYYEEHGDLNIPQNYVTEDGVWLGKWVYLQREIYRRQCKNPEAGKETAGGPDEKTDEKTAGKLTEEQIRALESVGMDWLQPGERAWENAFRKAEAYYRKHRHLNVEKGFASEDGFRLDLWLKRQRKQYRDGSGKVLTADRIARLEGVGMRW